MIYLIISIWLVVGIFLAYALAYFTTPLGRLTIGLLWPVMLVYAGFAVLWELIALACKEHDKKEGQP